MSPQSELPRPIPWHSGESDHRGSSRIYFDNAGDNVTLTSQKTCLHNNKSDCRKTNGLNEAYALAIFYWKKKNNNNINFIYSADYTFWIIRISILIELSSHAMERIFNTPVPAKQMELFGT